MNYESIEKDAVFESETDNVVTFFNELRVLRHVTSFCMFKVDRRMWRIHWEGI